MTCVYTFLATQLDHDEQEIRRRLTIPAGFAHDGPCVNYEGQDPADRDEYDSCSRHVAAMEARRADPFPYHDLGFALQQLAAHRRILTRHRQVVDGDHPDLPACSRCRKVWPCPDLRDLASVYAGRVGYQPDWAVA